MRTLFTLATFVGSFALFLLEPMVAKALLPSFGGSSLVWNGCLLFFQAALLGGYAYANALSSRANLRVATPFHWGVIGVALALTAALLVPAGLWHVRPAPDANPLLPLLFTLLLTTAAPFVVLAAGTPLIQRWFAHSNDPDAHDPYFLYAASNLGSFCGLIAYPVVIEPRLTLAGQRLFVLGLFAVYAIILVVASAKVRAQADALTPLDEPANDPEPVTASMRFRWAALSAAPSALLLAVTSDLTKNIAPIPLLWVLPLGLYLLTFVIVFSGRARKLKALGGAPVWLRIALAIALTGSVYTALVTSPQIQWAIALAVGSFFFTALVCHLQLARLRPAVSQLTDYYLWISIGGVLGGLFCALLAPLIFTGLTELPLALGACVLLYAFLQPIERLKGADVLVCAAAVAGLLLIAHLYSIQPFEHSKLAFVKALTNDQWTSILIGLVFLAVSLWPRRFAIVFIGYLALFSFNDKNSTGKVLFNGRNFYGYETVTSWPSVGIHKLVNGNILHGVQFVDPVLSREPTTYYAKDGPLGQALLPTLDSHPNARVAAVGLGSGTEAAYGRPGMQIDFYELNPAIERIAKDPTLFTYLRDSAAKINVILGDARLSLAEAPNASYDAIILDAFSSDSIPIHLITSEAMQMYKSKLKPDGILLVHTSNRYLRLSHVVAAAGAVAGFVSDQASDSADFDAYPDAFVRGLKRSATSWMALAGSRDRLRPIQRPGNFWIEFTPKEGTKSWTDDYSNVFGALKLLNKE